MGGSGKYGMTRELVLGQMPAGASPQTHLAAGAWCFAGREEEFPDWEKTFTFAPEPLADRGCAEFAAKAAKALAATQIVPVAARICPQYAALPPDYWQMLLAPWAIDVSSQIVERFLRCQAMIRKWGSEKLLVRLLPSQTKFAFTSEHDFSLRGTLGEAFNLWLFSILLQASWPKAWIRGEACATPLKAPPQEAISCKGALRAAAGKMLLRLPFPKLKGMGVAQALLFSAAMLGHCHSDLKSADFEKTFACPDVLEKISLPANITDIFMVALPASIANLSHKPIKSGNNNTRWRIASIIAYENAAYRQNLARWRAKGNRIAFVQHGGNYGLVRIACNTEFVEYSQAAFFTWGWKKHGKTQGNFIPMPYPQLADEENRWQPAKDRFILFTGTEMAAYGYRLDSRPTPLEFVAYRQAKADFFQALGEDLRLKSFYRPYFPLPGTLQDGEWLLARFPELKICQGALLPRLLCCGLLVLDHHGTTMLEAFAANAPLVLYWNRNHWPLTDEGEKLVDMLEECGIWHDSPVKAAAMVKKIWRDPAQWWLSEPVQKARRQFCELQARLPHGNLNAIWLKKLKSL